MSDASRPPLFPVFIDLAGRRAVVIGGGEVAARKVRSLLAAGAVVQAIAPAFEAGLEELAGQPGLELVRRAYVAGDLQGSALAFAATDDAEANAAVFAEAEAAGIWANVADDPAHCSFYVPSRVNRGPVCIAISTQGDSPALARHLRERIEEVVPLAYGELAHLLGRLREEVKARVPSLPERRRRWNAVVESHEVFELLAQGREAAAERLARRMLGLEEAAK